MNKGICIFRHHTTNHTQEHRFSEVIDTPVTETRNTFTRVLIQFISSFIEPNDKTFSYPPAHSQFATKITPLVLEDYHKQYCSLRRGLTRDEICERFSEEYQIWDASIYSYGLQKGETGGLVLNPSIKGPPKISETRYQQVFLMLHNSVNRLVIFCLLGLVAKKSRTAIIQFSFCFNSIGRNSTDDLKKVSFDYISNCSKGLDLINPLPEEA